ncbi:MAG: hypothetical protein K2J89_07085 [Clostridia bacterium]|nr:hypothetical protein [Clostridia bacterium]
MIKKKISIFLIVVMIVGVLFAVAACKNDDGDFLLDDASGKVDPYGRQFNNVYDIDEYLTGEYAVSYDIDASAMGKSMLKSNCADRVSVKKTEEGYVLTFYCMNDSFTEIALDGEEAQNADRGDAKGYAFDVEREELDGELNMSGYVSAMKRSVEFKIVLDLNDAILIG